LLFTNIVLGSQQSGSCAGSSRQQSAQDSRAFVENPADQQCQRPGKSRVLLLVVVKKLVWLQ